MYSGIKFTNNASTQLTQTLLATDTVLYVGTNGASIFPKLDTTDDYFLLTLFDVNKNREVVKCTARTDDSCTIVRAQEGTTARTFQAGTLVELRLTANSITKVAEDASIVKYHASTTAADVGKADATKYGHIKLSDNFESGDQAITGTACSPYGFQQAVNRLLNVATTTLLTESGAWVVPETGVYTVTCIGAGGKGGAGGSGLAKLENIVWKSCGDNCEYDHRYYGVYAGGGGGGGGAGQVKKEQVLLTKGTVVNVTVGAAPSGSTTFGSFVSALGGGVGGNGGSPGAGGVGGVSYCNAAMKGADGGSASFETWYGWAAGTDTVGGSSGGAGAISYNGTYGNGGKGGSGGGASVNIDGDAWYGGSAGTVGTQGAVYITMTLGS